VKLIPLKEQWQLRGWTSQPTSVAFGGACAMGAATAMTTLFGAGALF